MCMYTWRNRRMCRGDGLFVCQVPDHVDHVLHRALGVTGDWKSASITFHCRARGCTGNISEQCRDMAVIHMVEVVRLRNLKSRLSMPPLSRWWKGAPCASVFILVRRGHRLLPHFTPHKSQHSCHAAYQGSHEVEDEWHAQHGFRIRASV